MPKKRIVGLVLMVLEAIACIRIPPSIQKILDGEGGVIWPAVGFFLPGLIGFSLFMLSFNKRDKEDSNSEKVKKLPSVVNILIAVAVVYCVIRVGMGISQIKKSGDNKAEPAPEAGISNNIISEDSSSQSETNTTSRVTTITETVATAENAKEDVTTTTTEKTTTTTTATTIKTKDAQKNNYEMFETTLVVHVDEADTLPLRSTTDKSDNIIIRIPDGMYVSVLGYREVGSEIWFRVSYAGDKGWVRGGMLQPERISDLDDDLFDIPALNKWKNKFIIEYPEKYVFKGTGSFKGSLYYLPDLSSGVQKRFKSGVDVNIYATKGDWYYVEFSSYEGWVYSGQVSM